SPGPTAARGPERAVLRLAASPTSAARCSVMDVRAMREIDEALNSRLHLPRGAAGFRTARDRWCQRQRRGFVLEWRTEEEDALVADFDGGSFHIRPAPDGDHLLLYVWPRGGSRVLSLGAPSHLREYATALIFFGGPF